MLHYHIFYLRIIPKKDSTYFWQPAPALLPLPLTARGDDEHLTSHEGEQAQIQNNSLTELRSHIKIQYLSVISPLSFRCLLTMLVVTCCIFLQVWTCCSCWPSTMRGIPTRNNQLLHYLSFHLLGFFLEFLKNNNTDVLFSSTQVTDIVIRFILSTNYGTRCVNHPLSYLVFFLKMFDQDSVN